MNKKTVVWIFIILILSGYLLAKMSGRRGDRHSRRDSDSHTVATATAEQIPILSQVSARLPNPPFLIPWCEGDHCQHEFSKKIGCDTNVLKEAFLQSDVLETLKPGDQIEARLYYTKVLKLGSYLPLEAPERILVSHAGEKSWVSFHDEVWDSVEWPSLKEEQSPTYAIVYPKTEAWALIKTKSGLSGFIKMNEKHSFICPFIHTK